MLEPYRLSRENFNLKFVKFFVFVKQPVQNQTNSFFASLTTPDDVLYFVTGSVRLSAHLRQADTNFKQFSNC